MSKKVSDNLKQISNQFFCVFNDSDFVKFKSAKDIYLKLSNGIQNIGFIAVIQHENEYDEIEKRVKVNHYHVYFNLRYCLRCSLNSMLNSIVDLYNCNANQISIEKATDECMCVRYLCHLDNADKQPYLPFDIYTNDMELVGKYLAKKPLVKNVDDFINICESLHWKAIDIVLKIGEKNWSKYSKIFFDVKRDTYR